MKLFLLIIVIQLFYVSNIFCNTIRQTYKKYGLPLEKIKPKIYKYCIYSTKELDVSKWDYDWKDETDYDDKHISHGTLEYKGDPIKFHNYDNLPSIDINQKFSTDSDHNENYDYGSYEDEDDDHDDKDLIFIPNSANYLATENCDDTNSSEIITSTESIDVITQTEVVPELVTELINSQTNVTVEQTGSSQLILNNDVQLVVESSGGSLNEVFSGISEQVNSTNITIIERNSTQTIKNDNDDCDKFDTIPLGADGHEHYHPSIELIAGSNSKQIGLNFEHSSSSQDKLIHENEYDIFKTPLSLPFEGRELSDSNYHSTEINSNQKNNHHTLPAHGNNHFYYTNNYGNHFHIYPGSYIPNQFQNSHTLESHTNFNPFNQKTVSPAVEYEANLSSRSRKFNDNI